MAPKITLENVLHRAVVTLPEAGQLLGLGRSSAYAAATRGEIPTLCIGRRKIVPVAALLRLLELSDPRHASMPAPRTSSDEPAAASVARELGS